MEKTPVNKKNKSPTFQVLLIDNNERQDVEVQEALQVNFLRVKQHLKSGGSVFITSKDEQKIIYPKTKAQINYSKSRKNLGALLHQHINRL